MAGAIAIAAVMEDFEGQPCKKLRKDVEAPSVRTITSYFMPKPVEKPFSPPRSNNIMDYFKRTSPAQEIKSCSLVAEEKSPQPSEQVRREVAGKPRGQRQKRTRKTKDNKKSKEEDAQMVTNDVVLIESASQSPVKESDSVVIPSLTCNDVFSNEESGMRKSTTEADPDVLMVKNSGESAEHKPSLNQSRKKDCGNRKYSVRRKRKAKGACEETKECDVDAQEPVWDAKLEDSVDEKSSTVTISFEDFVQNQNQEQKESNAVPKTDTAKTSNEGNACNGQNDSAIGPLQVSPRTLTIQAEVHPISPDHHESVKAAKELKVASIFSRNKKSKSKEDKSFSASVPELKPDVLPDLKRKSNVVVLEEDLELDVMESSSNPKSTEAERKQFMNAFKQPSHDGCKSKTSKVQSKQNQVQDKDSETTDKEDEEKSLENKPKTSSEQNEEQKSCPGDKKRRGRKAGKKGQATKAEDAQAAALKPDESPKDMEVESESRPPDNNKSEQAVKELRRSCRQSAAVLNSVPQKKERQENTVEDDEAQNTPSPSLALTPKAHRRKRGIYRAEILCPPDTKGSPIRMRITRVSSAIKAGDFEISSPLSIRELNAVKKRKQARKLVQKAKALQQSKKDTAKEKETVRRSTRSKESIISYCEDEDSVVFLDESVSTLVTSQESGKSLKKLRSLNEVLGRNTTQNKTSKTPAASKLAPLFVDKKVHRPSVVISIFDDSSQEASENSQDDEQFRAKREFLKSGLPESFKKQIAKTAASREAYSQTCVSFHTVVHVQQRAADCSVWNLPWPTNPFLVCIKESYNLPAVQRISLNESLGYTTVPAKRTFCQKVSCQNSEFSEPIRRHLLEEMRISNPSFPHQRFFMRFIKRREEYILQASASEPEGEFKAACTAGSSDGVGRKRKRVDEGETTGKVGKKSKASHSEGDVIVIEGSPPSKGQAALNVSDSVARSRSRRGRPQKQKQKEEPKPAELISPVGNQNDVHVLVDSSVPENPSKEDGVKEDVLWTEKYQPQHSSEIIGNMESVRRLHSWLKEWKLRADREEKRKQQEKKQEEDSNDSWLIGEGLDEAEDHLCNTLLITGPTGVGKTAAVYACAQELGFKVFEVNSSSQRSGRHILSQLKEATQSHQVDIQGVNTHKPSYFSSYSSNSTAIKPGTSPRKVNSPRSVVSSPRKPPQSPRSAPSRKGGLAPTSLANFFKAGGRATGKEANSQDKKTQPACLKKSAKAKETDGKESPSGTSVGSKISAEDQGKKSATSLILFEEVDIIFDDDTGFLAAVKTFMTTTKRPVILTTSDSMFGATFDGYFEEIHFKSPSVADVSSYLQLLCLVENMRTDTKDVSCLLDWNSCDIRQSLLHLQFWARSGGGQQVQRPLPSELKEDGKSDIHRQSIKSQDVNEDKLPPCHTACTETLLGIRNMHTKSIADLLLKRESSILESMKCWDLLSKVHRMGVDLLYSNMENLLPLPTRPLPQSTLKLQSAPNPQSQPDQVSQTVRLAVLEEPSDDGSPLKLSSRMKGRKKMGMGNKDVFQSDSDSEEDFLSLPKINRDPAQSTNAEAANLSMNMPEAAPKKPRHFVLSEAERKKSKPVMHCLSSLAEYMDHMSFLDSSLHFQAESSRRQQDFGWTSAKVKSGMTDDIRLDCVSRVNGVSEDEIHAALGHLSFRKCKAVVSEAWDRAQQLEEEIRSKAEEELTLPVAPQRDGFSLAQVTPCEPRLMERRSEVITSVLSTMSAGMLGNRAAVALDYLPSLRTICRSERLKEEGKIKRRFLHYLDGIHFTLPKSVVESLASEFP